MKFRVLTNGEVFCIQTRRCFIWRTESTVCGYFIDALVFKTESLAVDYVYEQYGKSAKRIRKTRVI